MSQEQNALTVKRDEVNSQVFFVLGLLISFFIGPLLGVLCQMTGPDIWTPRVILCVALELGALIGVLFGGLILNTAVAGGLVGFPMSFGLTASQGNIYGTAFAYFFFAGLTIGFGLGYGVRWLYYARKKAQQVLKAKSLVVSPSGAAGC